MRERRLFYFILFFFSNIGARERAGMVTVHMVNLEGKFYSCKNCETHLGLKDEIVSKVSIFMSVV